MKSRGISRRGQMKPTCCAVLPNDLGHQALQRLLGDDLVRADCEPGVVGKPVWYWVLPKNGGRCRIVRLYLTGHTCLVGSLQ